MAKLPAFKPTKQGKIRRFSKEAAALAREADARAVVAKLAYGDLDPKGKEHRIKSAGTVRLDRQGNVSGGGANLQIQLNEVKGQDLPKNAGTTLAQVIVPREVYDVADQCPEKNVRTALVRATRSGLLKSLAAAGGAFEVVER